MMIQKTGDIRKKRDGMILSIELTNNPFTHFLCKKLKGLLVYTLFNTNTLTTELI